MTVGDGLFPPDAYARDDESPDREFYGVPRKVVHIDDGAVSVQYVVHPVVVFREVHRVLRPGAPFEGADRSGGGGDPLHAVWARK